MHLFQKSNFSCLFDAGRVFPVGWRLCKVVWKAKRTGKKTPLDKVKLKGKAKLFTSPLYL